MLVWNLFYLESLKYKFFRENGLDFRSYCKVLCKLPAKAFHDFSESAGDSLSIEVKIKKFVANEQKCNSLKMTIFNRNFDIFFCALERFNFAVGTHFEVNSSDFEIEYQVLQTSKN